MTEKSLMKKIDEFLQNSNDPKWRKYGTFCDTLNNRARISTKTGLKVNVEALKNSL